MGNPARHEKWTASPLNHNMGTQVKCMSQSTNSSFILGNLLHLSYNMWQDADGLESPERKYRRASPKLRFDEKLWRDLTQRMADAGMNMVVLDLGDGVKYQSHPEIAVEGAWSVGRLKEESARLREMGLELIPKLNFSTCHDEWLGPYARMVSTPIYYKVCRELIAEVIDLLDKPRFFHLGLDEETARHQTRFSYVVIRQHELIWHDMLWFIEQAQSRGVRPWIWSDFIWNHPDEFVKRMPKSVLQSNWYYGPKFEFAADDPDAQKTYVAAYRQLEAAGYDQIPTCSNVNEQTNTAQTVEHCRQWIAPERLKGFLQTTWRPTMEEFREQHEQAIDQLAQAAGAARRA
jgi:hypothetical protein